MDGSLEAEIRRQTFINNKHIAGTYFARIIIAENRENEITAVQAELAEDQSMSSLSNEIWAMVQEQLEEYDKKIEK